MNVRDLPWFVEAHRTPALTSLQTLPMAQAATVGSPQLGQLSCCHHMLLGWHEILLSASLTGVLSSTCSGKLVALEQRGIAGYVALRREGRPHAGPTGHALGEGFLRHPPVDRGIPLWLDQTDIGVP